jgi:cobalamin biosynthesis Mg chelatase CobN
MICPASSPISIMRGFGIDVHASLMLTSTALDLSQRLTPIAGSQTSNGSDPGSTTPNGPGGNQGSSPGSTTTPNPRPNPSSGGYNPSSSSTPTGAGQPTSNPAQSKPSTQSAGLLPWMYGILGIAAATIVASGVWMAGRRMKKAPFQIAPAQASI